MRLLVGAVSLVLVLFGSSSPVVAQTPGKALSGYRYVLVQSPQYEQGEDVYGFGRYVMQKLREDKSWTVLNDRPTSEPQDRSQANETVVCALSHEAHGGVATGPHITLQFYDLAGALVTSVDRTPGFVNGWSFQGDIKRAIDNALKLIARDRRFNPNLVVDIAARYKNVETVDMDEVVLRRYLDDNSAHLHQLEGIWSSQDGQYRLGLMRRGTSGRIVAFVLETKNVLWQPKMLKATFDATAYPELFTANYFMGNHQSVGATAKVVGGVLSIPVTANGREDIVSFIKNYPANVSLGSEPAPGATPASVMSGTGFVVGRNLVVTCNHVIQNAKRIEVTFDDGKRSFPLDVVTRDEANDLAVLRVLPNDSGAYPALTPLTFPESGDVRLGQQVYTIGFPLGAVLGESPKATEGTVSAVVGLQNDPRTFQISVPVQPGNSGGPLFDDKGRVVGVVVASLSAKYLYQAVGAMPQNVNFAVRSDYLLTLLRQTKAEIARGSSLADLSRVEQIEQLRASVGQVRAHAQ